MNTTPPSFTGPTSLRPHFVSVVLLVSGLILYVWCHVETLAQGEHLRALRAEREALLKEADLLRAEVSTLQRSSRIHKIAQNQLGMRFPDESPRNLYVSHGGGQ